MANRIQLRRDTTANWNSVDPVLADGEPGYDIVTNELRIGNGSNTWSQLSANTISGGGGGGTSIYNSVGSATVGSSGQTWEFSGTAGVLTLPRNSYLETSDANLKIGSPGNVTIRSNAATVGGTHTWNFHKDGNLQLPAGGTITEANVGLADALILTPANISYSDQQLRIYSTGGMVEGNHLHLTTGNLYATELYLGDDNYFVKLGNTGNVGIRAATQSLSSTALWTFDTSGNLRLPAGGVIVNSDSSQYGAISTSSSVSTLIVSDTSGDYQYGSLAYNYTVNGNGGGFTIAYSAPLAFGNVDINVGNVVTTGTANVGGNLIVGGNLLLSAGGEIYSESGTGNVTIEANDGNNVRSWTFTGNGVIQNPVLTIATLPSASPAGQRAFVSDGADTAVTWSVAVSATGSNTYPVWSDGIVWRYG
jgi:hypothetical protein